MPFFLSNGLLPFPERRPVLACVRAANRYAETYDPPRHGVRSMRAMLLTVAALLLTTPLAHAVEKSAVDAAVDSGVAALKKLQRNDGTWPYEKVGATALAGLT